jgi:hypothetical protein
MAHGGILRTAAVTVTATLLCALVPGAVAPAAAEHTASAPDEETGEGFSPRRYYTTWRDSRSYWSQDTRYATGGWLWAGRHAFFCQLEGEPHTDGEGRPTTWWVLTDDSVGNKDVFVSATALRVAEPWKPVDGLPRC